MKMIQGKVIQITESKRYSEKFAKQTIVVQTAGNYPDEFEFEFVNDDQAKLLNINIGDTVAVDYEIRGRRWPKDAIIDEAKWFMNLRGTSIELISQGVLSVQNDGILGEPEGDPLPF